MVTRCIFGIFVFGTHSDLIYRFLTDGLLAYLHKCFIDREYTTSENKQVRKLIFSMFMDSL